MNGARARNDDTMRMSELGKKILSATICVSLRDTTFEKSKINKEVSRMKSEKKTKNFLALAVLL